MTDLEKFLNLVKDFNIYENKEPRIHVNNDGNTEVGFYSGQNDKIRGHTFFYSAWEFSPEGKFISTAAWETD